MKKFHVHPWIRYFLRYFTVGIYLLFPIYSIYSVLYNETMFAASDRPLFLLLGCFLLIMGCCLLNFIYLERCFPVLILSNEEICWKCPFRKTIRIPVNQCIEIGAYLENANNGIPSEQIYFSDCSAPSRFAKKGILTRSEHLVKFAYTEELYQYIIKNYPSKLTGCLLAYHRQRKR